MCPLRINCIFLYQYKGNSKRFLVGCFAKVPSLNSHENGFLLGCFFKNSKYVYNIPSYKSLGNGKNAPPIFKNYRPRAKRKSRYITAQITDFSVCTCYVTAFARKVYRIKTKEYSKGKPKSNPRLAFEFSE